MRANSSKKRNKSDPQDRNGLQRKDQIDSQSGGQCRTYYIKQLSCAHCAAMIEKKINALPAVNSAVLTFSTKQLKVYSDNSEDQFLLIQKISTSVEPGTEVVPTDDDTVKEEGKETLGAPGEKTLLILITGAALLIVGIAAGQSGHMLPAALICLAAYVLTGGRVLIKAAKNIAHGRVFDENFLMCIATIGALIIHEYPEAVGVMLFYRVGDFFEDLAVEQSRSQIMEASDIRPEMVLKIVEEGGDESDAAEIKKDDGAYGGITAVSGEKIVEMAAEDARIGDLLLLRPGDRVSLDGVVTEGESRIDTSPVTGEPVPVFVDAGSEIISGCINTSGLIRMRVTKPLSESMVTRILHSVEEAAERKPKVDRLIGRFCSVYTPCVVLGALAVAILPILLGHGGIYWIYTAITFLVISCPCALVLSVPLAFFSGIGAASKRGILYKSGLAIEAESRIKTVLVDKTGTLTEGDFKLRDVRLFGEYDEAGLLSICAAAESLSTHPLARSIVAAAEERKSSVPCAGRVREIPGKGIEALVWPKSAEAEKGRAHICCEEEYSSDRCIPVLCGSRSLMEERHIAMPADAEGNRKDESKDLADDGTEVWVAVDGEAVGILTISDAVKESASCGVRSIKKMGIHTVMLTGDNESAARRVAKEIGIDEAHAGLLPDEKLSMLKRIRAERGAAMYVGDGINDAPVLAGADVGGAMGRSADVAVSAADVVFMNNSVEAICDSLRIAKMTCRISVWNMAFALAVKLLVIVLGICGYANMWMAVFADTGVALICVLNSIRILYFPRFIRSGSESKGKIRTD